MCGFVWFLGVLGVWCRVSQCYWSSPVDTCNVAVDSGRVFVVPVRAGCFVRGFVLISVHSDWILGVYVWLSLFARVVAGLGGVFLLLLYYTRA